MKVDKYDKDTFGCFHAAFILRPKEHLLRALQKKEHRLCPRSHELGDC